ncbi:MAG: TIGR04086 family membrane protein [Firmicutes bacterium]|nr:TIGR04086 family membrane protein [Bacillota bacterium]MDY3658998.1 TIGR04086 family membrane protein [Eubacteriales bacterium]
MKIKALKFKSPKIKMPKNREVSEQDSPKAWLTVLKGSLVALSISLVSILIFAFFIKYVAVPTNAIKPINQVIKGLSLLIGTFVALKKVDKMGLINGLLIGLAYTILAFVVFSILDGHFEFTKSLVNDLLFGGLIGGICGVIAVNFRRKTN